MIPSFEQFKDVIYLFDLELHKPIAFKSKSDNAYEVALMLDFVYGYPYSDTIPTGYKIQVCLMGPEICEHDHFSGGHMDDKFVFDFLKWFHDDPKSMHKTLYHDFFKVVKQG